VHIIVRNLLLLSVAIRCLDRSRMQIKSTELGFRKRLRHDQGGDAMTASNVCNTSSGAQLLLDAVKRGYPIHRSCLQNTSSLSRRITHCRKNVLVVCRMARGVGPMRSQNTGWSVRAATTTPTSTSASMKPETVRSRLVSPDPMVGIALLFRLRTDVRSRRFS
jgi:hypothetical protein